MEALVALVILGTAVSAGLAVFSAGLRGATAVRAHATAVRLAEARLSELSLAPADSLHYYAEGRDGRFAAPFDAFVWRARLTRVTGVEGLLRGVVLVRWNGGDYQLSTEVFRRELVTGVRWRPR
jgi:hypothetical protein